MKNLLFLCLICAIFGSCKNIGVLKSPVLFSRTIEDIGKKDSSKTYYDDICSITYQRGFDDDVIRLFSVDSIIVDTVSTNYHMSYGIEHIFSSSEKYVIIKLNKGIKRKVKFRPDYLYVYVTYRWGVLTFEYSNESRFYY